MSYELVLIKKEGFIMKVLKASIGLFNIVSLFVMMIVTLIVGMVGESVKVAVEKIGNYELPKQRFKSLLRDFRTHSKPAYY